MVGQKHLNTYLFPWAHLQVIIMLLDLMSHPWESHIPYILSWCIHYTYSLGMAVQRASILNRSSAATLAPCSWGRAARLLFSCHFHKSTSTLQRTVLGQVCVSVIKCKLGRKFLHPVLKTLREFAYRPRQMLNSTRSSTLMLMAANTFIFIRLIYIVIDYIDL